MHEPIHSTRLCASAVVLALAIWLLPVVAFAQPSSDGKQEGDALDAPAPFSEVIAKAEAGDPQAQCELGVALLNGDRVAQDFRKALAWLTVSSDAGFGYARYVLANVYSRGNAGVPVNEENAYYYASLAAASSTLPLKFRELAAKLRDASAKRLTVAQVARVQARAALAPLGPTAETTQ